MRTGNRVILAALLTFAALAGAAVDCKTWLTTFPDYIGDLQALEPASASPAGRDQPNAACLARRDYISPESWKKATMVILQGVDSKRWIAYDLKKLLVVGETPACTWETVSGQKVMLHIGIRPQGQPAASSLVYSPKDGFLLELEVESPEGKPAPTREEMIGFGEKLPLAKFAEACAKIK